MAKLPAQYRVDCDPPGMNLPGAGGFLAGSSIVPPGTVLTLPADFDPHACMTPLNKAAEASFARRRKEAEAEWREALPQGVDPSGKPLEGVELPLSKEQIEARVKLEVSKVGPRNKKLQREIQKKERPRLSPGSMRVSAPVMPDEDPAEDDLADIPRASEAE